MALTLFGLIGSIMNKKNEVPMPIPFPSSVVWSTTTIGTTNNWSCVTYGQSMYVALSTNGNLNRLGYSYDGINWTTTTSSYPVNNQTGGNINNTVWRSVTYANGIFVAVGDGSTNSSAYSLNGIAWFNRASATVGGIRQNYQSVTFGNGLYVAVASNNIAASGQRVMTTPGLVNGVWAGWTLSSTASISQDVPWVGIAFGNSIFVAVSSSGLIMTSPDGITWTERTSPNNNAWSSVAFGNGLFVAVATSGTGTRVITSQDGTSWSVSSLDSSFDLNWSSIAFGNGLFVAISSSSSMVSSNGVNWTIVSGGSGNSIAYGIQQFVSVVASTPKYASLIYN